MYEFQIVLEQVVYHNYIFLAYPRMSLLYKHVTMLMNLSSNCMCTVLHGNLSITAEVCHAGIVASALASFPGPRRGGEKGLVSTVCACA